MLNLNMLHRGHCVGAVHASIVRVKEKHYRAGNGEDGKYPSAPNSAQGTSGPEHFDDTQSEKNDRKRFVLKDFKISCDAGPPVFRAKGPKFGIAENENENS